MSQKGKAVMDEKKWSFPVLKAARWATPVRDPEGNPTEETFEDWMLWVKAGDLPMDIPLDPNARYPDITQKTPRAIARTVRMEPSEFVKRNNGICMVARACHVRDNVATLHLNVVGEVEEREEGRRGDGILNGGHTYAVVKDERARYEKDPASAEDDADRPNPRDAVIRLEVQTGLNEEDLAEISRARNLSVPVQEYSLKNLGNAWQAIKTILPREIRKRVQFMENDPEAPEGQYDVGDLVRLLALFNSKVYPVGKKDPISAYTSEKRLIANWNGEDFDHLLPHLLEFIRLHDEITLMYPKVMGSKPGKVNGVISYDKNEPWILLGGKPSKYFVPPPFTFPVLAALRVFLSEDGSKWHVSPDTLLRDENYVKALISETWSEYQRSGRYSASFFGRNRQVWKMLSLVMLVKRQSAAA